LGCRDEVHADRGQQAVFSLQVVNVYWDTPSCMEDPILKMAKIMESFALVLQMVTSINYLMRKIPF
jgi:hypothetical protein